MREVANWNIQTGRPESSGESLQRSSQSPSCRSDVRFVRGQVGELDEAPMAVGQRAHAPAVETDNGTALLLKKNGSATVVVQQRLVLQKCFAVRESLGLGHVPTQSIGDSLPIRRYPASWHSATVVSSFSPWWLKTTSWCTTR